MPDDKRVPVLPYRGSTRARFPRWAWLAVIGGLTLAAGFHGPAWWRDARERAADERRLRAGMIEDRRQFLRERARREAADRQERAILERARHRDRDAH